MTRLARAELFAYDEIATVHVMNRVVRRCYLMGSDPVSGKNYDYRRAWIEELLVHFAGQFGIDLLGFAILSNHFHLILRSRPDCVAQWNDAEVARRWMLICPKRKDAAGNPAEPSQSEIDLIRNDPVRLAETRKRLSNISWWMRLLCQRVAQRANAEDRASGDGQILGKFWQNRYRAVRLLDEAALVACTAYVDLNPIRAGIATTLATSDHTSIQRRIEALFAAPAMNVEPAHSPALPTCLPPGTPAQAYDRQIAFARDSFLSPLPLGEAHAPVGPHLAKTPFRCSDKGFLPLTIEAYLELLNWTVENVNKSSLDCQSLPTPEPLRDLGITGGSWCRLVSGFGKLFSLVAGRPVVIDEQHTRMPGGCYRLSQEARELLTEAA